MPKELLRGAIVFGVLASIAHAYDYKPTALAFAVSAAAMLVGAAVLPVRRPPTRPDPRSLARRPRKR